MPYAMTVHFPSFACAHRLTGLSPGHKCMRLHGHNYRLAVRLVADELTNGMIVDSAIVKEMAAPFIHNVDHYPLNELPFDDKATAILRTQPTAENLAWWFYEGLKPIEGRFPGVKIDCVALSETDGLTAEYVP